MDTASGMASHSVKGIAAVAAASTSTASEASQSGMKRLWNSVDIVPPDLGSLRTRFAQARIRLRELSQPQQFDGLHQRTRRVARFFLEGMVAIERLVAQGIRLVIADVAVKLGGVPGRDQAQILQPIDQHAAQRF